MIGRADVRCGADGVSVRCGYETVSSGEPGQGREVGKGSGEKFHTVAGSSDSAVHQGVEAFSAVGSHTGSFDVSRHEPVEAVPVAVYGLALVSDSCVW